MFKHKHSQRLAIVALIVLAVIWGYNWVVMKVAVKDAPPFEFAALRAFYGALSLFLLMIWLRKPIKPKAIWGTFGVGVLQSGGSIGLATWALVSGGVGKTAILTYTMSFWTLLLAWMFLGERLRRGQWLGVALAFVGLLFILMPFSLTSGLMSKGLAIAAGVSWALSAIIAKKVQQRMELDLLSFTAWQMLFGSLLLILVSLLIPSPPIHWSPSFIGALVYSAIPASAIAWLLWLYALKHLPTGMAALGALLTPVVGVLVAAVQLGEIPSLTELVGMVLIVTALVLNGIWAIKSQSAVKTRTIFPLTKP